MRLLLPLNTRLPHLVRKSSEGRLLWGGTLGCGLTDVEDLYCLVELGPGDQRARFRVINTSC